MDSALWALRVQRVHKVQRVQRVLVSPDGDEFIILLCRIENHITAAISGIYHYPLNQAGRRLPIPA